MRGVSKVKVGMPWEDDTQMGSQIDQNQMNKILEYVEIAKQEAVASSAAGSARPKASLPRAPS